MPLHGCPREGRGSGGIFEWGGPEVDRRCLYFSDISAYRPNQRARRLEPKCSLSARNATDGS